MIFGAAPSRRVGGEQFAPGIGFLWQSQLAQIIGVQCRQGQSVEGSVFLLGQDIGNMHDGQQGEFDRDLNSATLVLRSTARPPADLTTTDVPSGFDLRICNAPDSFTGTVGSVRAATRPDATTLLIIYGDSLMAADIKGLLEAHRRCAARGGAATLLYHRPLDLRRAGHDGHTYHGVMSVDPHGRVMRFVEKPLIRDVCQGFDLANAAVFLCERALIEHPEFKGAKDFSFDVFEPASRDNVAALFGHDIGSGFRLDVGSLERLYEVNMAVLDRQYPVPILAREVSSGIWIDQNTECDLAHIRPPVVLGRSVHIGRHSLIGPHVVIGNNAFIGDAVTIAHTLILEGSMVGSEAVVEASIVGPFSRVGRGVRVPSCSVLGPYSVAGSAKW